MPRLLTLCLRILTYIGVFVPLFLPCFAVVLMGHPSEMGHRAHREGWLRISLPAAHSRLSPVGCPPREVP